MAEKRRSRFWTSVAKRLIQEGFITPDNKKDYMIRKIGLAFTDTGSFSARQTFSGPEGFSFEEIDAAYFTDSYIRTATDKKTGFMFKSGWELVGKNADAVSYVDNRLKAIALATDSPTNNFFTEIATSLIKFYNCFIVKARATTQYKYPPGITAKAVFGNTPVAGYYILPAETMTIARDAKGKILKYKQTVGREEVEFKPADIIHLYVNKPPGRPFGLPSLASAIDDVKMLRQAEELVSRYLYKHIFPLLTYKVGTENEAGEIDDDELKKVREHLAELPLDGGLVMPGRHSIEAIKQEGLTADAYLKYFKTRVFTALEVSATIMGEVDTSNRSTADNQDQMFKDKIKSYQRTMADFINFFMIFELLLEGGYDPFTNPDDNVQFRFKEVDMSSLIAYQNHAMQLFMQNGITHSEMRQEIGKDVLTDEEKNELYFQMVQATLKAIAVQQKIDGADNKSQNDDIQNAESTKQYSIHESIIIDNSSKLADILNAQYEAIKRDIIKETKQGNKDILELKAILNSSIAYMERKAKMIFSDIFILAGMEAQRQSNKVGQPLASYNLDMNALQTFTKLTRKLFNEIESKLIDKEITTERTMAVFESYKNRLSMIAKSEVHRAYNHGFAAAARALGFKNAISRIAGNDTCAICQQKNNQEVDIYDVEALPPYHTNCECTISILKEDNN